MKQVQEIIENLPNLKNVYILGNPDTSVDPEFCNIAAREFIKKGKKVMFSTSGFNGLNTIKSLTKNINAENIKYISYSIDSLKNEKLQKLKGNKNINLEEIEKAILYCIKNNIKVKIQPTLWKLNQDEYKNIMQYFYDKYNINWYTFHIGSFEAISGVESDVLKHIDPKKCVEIRNDIKNFAIKNNLKVQIPKVFITQEELKEYDYSETHCRIGGEGIQIWMEKEFLRCTFCPIYAEINKDVCFNLVDKTFNFTDIKTICPVAEKCISNNLKSKSINFSGIVFEKNDKKYYNICRYTSEKINY